MTTAQRPGTTPRGADGATTVVVFTLGDAAFAVPVAHVREVIGWRPPTALPTCPPFVEGVIALRGRIVPVIDLRTHLGIVSSRASYAARVLIVGLGDTLAGFVVDTVEAVVALDPRTLHDPPDVLADGPPQCVQAIVDDGDRMLLVLDLATVLPAAALAAASTPGGRP